MPKNPVPHKSPQPAQPVLEPDVMLLPPFNVVLLDDDAHTYEYVVEMITKIFHYDKQKAFKMAKEVDTAGRVILWTGPKEHAECKRELVHGFGADPRIPHCKGSMTAIVEAAN